MRNEPSSPCILNHFKHAAERLMGSSNYRTIIVKTYMVHVKIERIARSATNGETQLR